MKQRYYYAQLMTGKKKRSYASKAKNFTKKIFAMSGFAVDASMSISHPFIRGCDFKYNEIELYRIQDPNDTISIPYSGIKWIDLYVVARRWAGGGMLIALNVMYNFDLVIHLEHGWEIEVEFPADFAFKKIMEELRPASVPVIDVFDVFVHFPDEKTFKKEFPTYFGEHYHDLAMQYGLEDPRVTFNPM